LHHVQLENQQRQVSPAMFARCHGITRSKTASARIISARNGAAIMNCAFVIALEIFECSNLFSRVIDSKSVRELISKRTKEAALFAEPRADYEVNRSAISSPRQAWRERAGFQSARNAFISTRSTTIPAVKCFRVFKMQYRDRSEDFSLSRTPPVACDLHARYASR
jgi:hypothetical protein